MGSHARNHHIQTSTLGTAGYRGVGWSCTQRSSPAGTEVNVAVYAVLWICSESVYLSLDRFIKRKQFFGSAPTHVYLSCDRFINKLFTPNGISPKHRDRDSVTCRCHVPNRLSVIYCIPTFFSLAFRHPSEHSCICLWAIIVS